MSFTGKRPFPVQATKNWVDSSGRQGSIFRGTRPWTCASLFLPICDTRIHFKREVAPGVPAKVNRVFDRESLALTEDGEASPRSLDPWSDFSFDATSVCAPKVSGKRMASVCFLASPYVRLTQLILFPRLSVSVVSTREAGWTPCRNSDIPLNSSFRFDRTRQHHTTIQNLINPHFRSLNSESDD